MQIELTTAKLSSMQDMNIQLISVKPVGRHFFARARANAPLTAARIWIELTFEPSSNDPWSEAYDRVLDLLDIA